VALIGSELIVPAFRLKPATPDGRERPISSMNTIAGASAFAFANRSADAPRHRPQDRFDELRQCHRNEGRVGLPGYGRREQCLVGAGRARMLGGIRPASLCVGF
jgi:hypothetical protein